MNELELRGALLKNWSIPSLMSQRDDLGQKQAFCRAIDACNGEIYHDWSGKVMTKEEAKKYVMEYK
jgi:hypothetical protein